MPYVYRVPHYRGHGLGDHMRDKTTPLTCYYCDEPLGPGDLTLTKGDGDEIRHARCPSLDRPRPVVWCALCDLPIKPGQRTGVGDGEVWHRSCEGTRIAGASRGRGVCEDAPCCGCCGVERWESWEDDQ